MIGRTLLGAAALFAGFVIEAHAAEEHYPFVGAWIRSDRQCSATSTRERIYTPRDVVSSRGRCAIRKVAAGTGQTYELFEKCDRQTDRTNRVSEIIRMTGPDGMVLTRKTARLKLSRSIRFNRCPLPAPRH